MDGTGDGVDPRAEERRIGAALAVPFDPREIKWKPQTVKNNRAMAIAYIDARLIEDRLDEVVGPGGWQDDYEILNDGSVVCRLRVLVGAGWVTKADVGSPSEQPDPGDRMKAAFSDALKRAAVKYGIGRYLYRLPHQWVEYDPVKKQILQPPQLPAFAIPARQKGGGAAPAKALPAGRAQAAAPAPGPAPVSPARAAPQTGPELKKRLAEHDATLAAAGHGAAGALIARVEAAGRAAGYPADVAEWAGGEVAYGVKVAREYDAAVKALAAASGPAPDAAAKA